MKSLFCMIVLVCSTLFNPSGASADVIDTGERFTLLDVNYEAASFDVAINEVKEICSVTVSYSLDMETSIPFVRNEEDIYVFTVAEKMEPDLREHQPWRYKQTFDATTDVDIAYRRARDGLLHA